MSNNQIESQFGDVFNHIESLLKEHQELKNKYKSLTKSYQELEQEKKQLEQKVQNQEEVLNSLSSMANGLLGKLSNVKEDNTSEKSSEEPSK